MKALIIKSLEVILFLSFFAIVLGFTFAIPVVGIIPGLVVGALVTGVGFTLISNNDNLFEIRALLQKAESK